jgi:hypothetical protein
MWSIDLKPGGRRPFQICNSLDLALVSPPSTWFIARIWIEALLGQILPLLAILREVSDRLRFATNGLCFDGWLLGWIVLQYEFTMYLLHVI